MTDTNKERSLMELIDDYAEARHIGGCYTYNAKTAEARAKVVASLSAEAEPVAWVDERAIAWLGNSHSRHAEITTKLSKEKSGERPMPIFAAPAQAPAPGWVSVDERLPESNVEVLCAGQGWGDPFVTACYYDDERREWYPTNTHWTDSTGQAQYPTHWMPLPAAPSSGKGG